MTEASLIIEVQNSAHQSENEEYTLFFFLWKYVWKFFKIHSIKKTVFRESVLPFGYKVWKILRFRFLTVVTLNISICLYVPLCDLAELRDILE
jgi:hypothetical protein